MAEFYRYIWRIRTEGPTPLKAVPVRIVTLESVGTEPMLCAEGDTVDVVGEFGLDLCVRDGYAELVEVTSSFPVERLLAGYNGFVGVVGENCEVEPGALPGSPRHFPDT